MASSASPDSEARDPVARMSFRVRKIPSEWEREHLHDNLKEKFQVAEFQVTSLCSTFHRPKTSAQQFKTALVTFDSGASLPALFGPLLQDERDDITVPVASNTQKLQIGNFLDMTYLHSPQNPEIDIIFVHGLGGHAIASWTAPNGTCWPRDLLCEDLPKWRILTFGYDVKLDKGHSTARLADYGQKLRDAILNTRKTKEDRERPLVLVGHSAGGTVITSAIHQMELNKKSHGDSALLGAIRCIVSFGVPLQGTDLDSLKELTKKRSEPSKGLLLDDFRADSEILRVLRRTIDGLKASHGSRLKFITCLEELREPGQVFVGKDQSRLYSADEDMIMIHANHRNMAKFLDMDASPYQTLLRHFEEHLCTVGKSMAQGRIFDLSSTRTLLGNEFIGRRGELERLCDMIERNRQPEQLSVVSIVGLPGVGKTQLALQYLDRFHTKYDISFSTYASGRVSFGETVSCLVQELLGKSERSVGANYTKLKSWLREHPETRVLLIFDDVDTVQYETYMEGMPRRGTGDIVVTTRGRAAAEYCAGSPTQVLELEGWSDLEALEYLHQSFPESIVVEDEEALKIIKSVNGLPLALEQVVQHTRFMGQSLSDTFADLSINKRSVFRGATARKSVVECFEKTFVGLEHRSPQALKLLSLLVFLDSQSLHADVLEHRNLISNSSLRDLDIVQLKVAAGVLKDFKLLKTNQSSKTSSIHGLAQELFHDWLPQEKRKVFLLEAIDFMWFKYPHRDVVHREDMWKQASLYLSHTLKVIDHCERYSVENQKVFDLWIRAARTLAEKDFGEQAKKLASRACAYSHIDDLQASPSEQIEALTAYGYVIHYGGNYKDAGPFYQKALDIARSNLGGSHKQTLTSLNNCADIIYKHGDIDGAIRAWKEVIATGREVFQNSEEGVHPYVSMVNLSEAYRCKGNAEALLEAETLLREAMKEFRRRQGEKSSWTLLATAELGTNLLCQIRLEMRQATQEAEDLLEQAYRGLSEVLGPEDQYTCGARDALAELWRLDVD